jgi:hypothetical protein
VQDHMLELPQTEDVEGAARREIRPDLIPHEWAPYSGKGFTGWVQCSACGAMNPPEEEKDERDDWDASERPEDTCGFRQVRVVMES